MTCKKHIILRTSNIVVQQAGLAYHFCLLGHLFHDLGRQVEHWSGTDNERGLWP